LRHLGAPARSAIPGEGSLRWLLVVLLGGVILVAALDAIGTSSWVGYIAAGGFGALAVTIATRERTGTEPMSRARQIELGWDALRTELARSRRHDRRFVLVGVPDSVWTPADAGPSEMVQAGASASSAVQELVRRPDRAWADEAMLLVLLTDCDRAQGMAFLQRARATMPQVFGDERVRLVVFPDDGITLGGLMGTMRAAVGEQLIEAPVS
jgi:hypothetical protein